MDIEPEEEEQKVVVKIIGNGGFPKDYPLRSALNLIRELRLKFYIERIKRRKKRRIIHHHQMCLKSR